jgi:hypothetical protein
VAPHVEALQLRQAVAAVELLAQAAAPASMRDVGLLHPAAHRLDRDVEVRVLVRVSFNGYYGLGALSFAFGALGTVLVFLYMPTPRVTPFVIAHIS